MNILVTGGAGFIGSHTCIEILKNKDLNVIIVDNLCNSKLSVIEKIEKISKRQVKFYQADICNLEKLDSIFKDNKIDGVIHFAGLKAVGESSIFPLKYYSNNLLSTLNLLNVMQKYNCKNLIFSSSATVYGNPDSLPIKENSSLSATNPYGKTKLYIEEILKDFYKSDNSFNITILRYFNPIGAHESGLIGEDPNDIPNNLIPYITQVLIGKLNALNIYGDDYNTIDGTGVRDYIHVCDLAYGHVCALKKLFNHSGLNIYNLGTGKGYSVLEIVKAFENVVGRQVPYKIVSRRKGDIDACYADTTKAFNSLGFKAKYDINKMVADSWNWQKNNIT